MADTLIPVKAKYTGTDVTSLGEYASGEKIPVTYIPTGASGTTVSLGDHGHSGMVTTATTNTFTKAQIPSTETATISTTKTLHFDTYQNFILTLGSGVNTLANPTTEVGNVGQTGTIIFIQPSSGAAGSVATATDYETVGGVALALSATNSQYDVVPYIIKADNSILLGNPQLNFA